MDQALIGNYCEVVTDSDTVYFLGDHVMGNRMNGLNLIQSLPGYKVHIRGNHDYDHSLHKQKVRDKWIPIYKDTFDEVIEDWDIIQQWDDLAVKLCHFPTTFQFPGDDKYNPYRPTIDDCDILLCGHVHDSWMTQPEQRTINVGADVHNFYPISQEHILDLVDKYF